MRTNLENNVTKDVQIGFHIILSKRVLFHGSITWTLRGQGQERIDAAQMRFLRSVEKVIIRDKEKNGKIMRI